MAQLKISIFNGYTPCRVALQYITQNFTFNHHEIIVIIIIFCFSVKDSVAWHGIDTDTDQNQN